MKLVGKTVMTYHKIIHIDKITKIHEKHLTPHFVFLKKPRFSSFCFAKRQQNCGVKEVQGRSVTRVTRFRSVALFDLRCYQTM